MTFCIKFGQRWYLRSKTEKWISMRTTKLSMFKLIIWNFILKTKFSFFRSNLVRRSIFGLKHSKLNITMQLRISTLVYLLHVMINKQFWPFRSNSYKKSSFDPKQIKWTWSSTSSYSNYYKCKICSQKTRPTFWKKICPKSIFPVQSRSKEHPQKIHHISVKLNTKIHL